MPDFGKDYLSIGAATMGSQIDNKLETLRLQQKTSLEKTLNSSKLAGKKGSSAHDSSEIEKAAQDFEALLLHQMMKTMWQTVPKYGSLSSSREEELYRDMLNQAVAESIAEGKGIGIKEVIAREMKKIEGVD